MATPNQETPGADAPPAGEEKPTESAPNSSTSGGLKGWLPLIVTTITMPALAYATTVFVLLPKMQKAVVAVSAAATNTTVATTPAPQSPSAEAKPPPSASLGKARAKSAEGGKEALDATLKAAGVKVTSDGKITVPLNKILVNVSGSMGSRYLLTSLTLASDKEGFGELILNNEAQLVDLASSVLSAKTIADLEKPEARTVIRLELETVFNNALGARTVQDVYFTEFAIQ
jgi:flagellar FliL protein